MSEVEHGEEVLLHLLNSRLTVLMGTANDDGSAELHVVHALRQTKHVWTFHVEVSCEQARQWRLYRPRPMCLMLYSARTFYRAMLFGKACLCAKKGPEALRADQHVRVCFVATRVRMYSGAGTHVQVLLQESL